MLTKAKIVIASMLQVRSTFEYARITRGFLNAADAISISNFHIKLHFVQFPFYGSLHFFNLSASKKYLIVKNSRKLKNTDKFGNFANKGSTEKKPKSDR